MTRLYLSAALISAAMLATPAIASTSHMTSWHRAADANPSASPTNHDFDGRAGIRAPRVGGSLPEPPDGENCDWGDDPHIC
jgi:hypothetical protein